MQRILTAALVLGAVGIATLTQAVAQSPTWPTKPVRIIVVAAPGGSLDNATRPLVEHLTKAFALEPGDLLFTGTPAGVGAAYNPPKFLKVGDTVKVEVERLGAIETVITQETARTQIG